MKMGYCVVAVDFKIPCSGADCNVVVGSRFSGERVGIEIYIVAPNAIRPFYVVVFCGILSGVELHRKRGSARQEQRNKKQ